jgi:cytochrome c oxidase subunit 2
VKNRTRLRLALIAGVFLLVNAACAQENRPLDWLSGLQSDTAREIGGLWNLVFWVAVAVFFLVEGAIVYALIKFRHRADDPLPVQTHGNTPLEIGWTIAPALILAVLAVPTLSGIWALAQEPPDALEVTVTGQQWWWRYDYPVEKVTTANELHIPINKPVRLALESGDIIHSFWVPKLAGKQDVVPGRTNYLNIEADKPGEYQGTCVEYCGLSHANMRLKVFAHTPEDFAKWVGDQKAEAARPTGGEAAEGEKLFQANRCVECHTIRFEGSKAIGTTAPDLTHFASRTTFAGGIFERTEENLIPWVEDAPGQKPGTKMLRGVADLGLSDEEIAAIVAYLQTLR